MKKTVVMLVVLAMLLCGCVPADTLQTDPVSNETVDMDAFISEDEAVAFALRDAHNEDYAEVEKKSIVNVEFTNSPHGYYYIVSWIPYNDRAYIRQWKVDAMTGMILQREETENAEYNPVPTEPQITTAPTEPAETEPPRVYDLKVEDWYTEPEYLSYEEYFAEDREYTDDNGGNWLKQDNGKIYSFGAVMKDDGLVIVGGAFDEAYLVPKTERFVDWKVIGADGQAAFLASTNEIGRIDLTTGVYSTMYKCDEIISLETYDEMVSYFISANKADDGMIYQINRTYLPTGQTDVLYEEQGAQWYYIHMAKVYSTLGDIRWTRLNPDYVDAMRKELADPDSEYKIGYYDNSEYWEAEDGIAMMLGNGYYMLLDEMEDGLGVNAQLMGIYNAGTGKFSEQEGIFDGCWYGSGYDHDHFTPEMTTAPDPIFIKERWFDVKEKANFVMSDPDDIGEYGTFVESNLGLINDYSSTRYLYLMNDGVYTKVTDIPIKEALNTSQCIIAITADNRILAISYDGTQRAELYRSVYGELDKLDVSYHGNYAAFVDGDYLILIDLVKQQYREVVYHQNIHWFALFALDSEDHSTILEIPEIYFDIAVGLYVQGYAINLVTGEIQLGYRL